jgi:hypothetical protein
VRPSSVRRILSHHPLRGISRCTRDGKLNSQFTPNAEHQTLCQPLSKQQYFLQVLVAKHAASCNWLRRLESSMSTPTLQEIALKLDEIAEDIRSCDDLDNSFDDLQQRFLQLEAQLHVQRSLQKTAKLLRQQTCDKALPKQHATRIKHFIKFTFEKTSRSNERSIRLRKLECNALKLCGLTYKIKEILELPAPQFDFLLANVTDFVHHNQLAQYLYRGDIDKFIFGKFDPEDDDLFKEFLKCLSSQIKMTWKPTAN